MSSVTAIVEQKRMYDRVTKLILMYNSKYAPLNRGPSVEVVSLGIKLEEAI